MLRVENFRFSVIQCVQFQWDGCILSGIWSFGTLSRPSAVLRFRWSNVPPIDQVCAAVCALQLCALCVYYISKVSWWTVASLLWSIDQVCAAVCALQLCALCVYYISKVSWWTVASLLWSIDQVCAAVCALQLCALCVYYISKVSW
jgi:hypothetical protein